jgi:DNA polymerase elongation subunit (family B)
LSSEGENVNVPNAKILMLDIETAPNKVYVWGLWNQNIGINQIVEPGYTLCFAAKWLGGKDIIYRSIHEDGPEEMIQAAWDLLDEADIVVHYNGTSFDVPTLNREFVMAGLDPPTGYHEVDLLKVVRKRFRFVSNKLTYITEQLGLGEKVEHKGMPLWTGCMNGDDASWRHMKKYNQKDIKLLESLYKQVLPWIKNHPNIGLWINEQEPVCRNCGSDHVQKRGLQYTSTMVYQRYRCMDCGTPQRGRTSLIKPNKGVLV